MGKAERQSKLERRQKTRLGREAAWAMADLDDRDAQMMADLDYSTSRARIPSLILITGALGVLLHCSPDWKWYVLPSFVACIVSVDLLLQLTHLSSQCMNHYIINRVWFHIGNGQPIA